MKEMKNDSHTFKYYTHINFVLLTTMQMLCLEKKKKNKQIHAK